MTRLARVACWNSARGKEGRAEWLRCGVVVFLGLKVWWVCMCGRRIFWGRESGEGEERRGTGRGLQRLAEHSVGEEERRLVALVV